ncbi:Hsp70 family protein [Streptomyces hokutonensis]|uniref:Hsp70 family protein n=1 Tax=Streptomyces hokutonensis TaxID=1306990 RepID=UPI00380DC13F
MLGIDFGTTNSAVGVFREGRVRIIPNRHGDTTTPSVVAFAPDGTLLVGRQAQAQALLHPEAAVHRVKLELGNRWTFRHGNRSHSAEEVASWILRDLRQSAEAQLGEEVNQAVLTVPAQFNHVQRAALADAAGMAGIEAVRMINEPTAAALSYGLLHAEDDATILVFDMGGGTLDISVLEVGDGVVETKGTGGDSTLGGGNWDRRIVEHLLNVFSQVNGFRPTGRPALRRLEVAAEQAKTELSGAGSTAVQLPYLDRGPAGPLAHLDTTLTRAWLEELTGDLLGRCEQPVQRALHTAFGSHETTDIDHFILVGGATRMPMITDFVRRLAGGREPNRSLGPEAVVTGATVQSAVLTGQLRDDLLLMDVTSLPLGIETEGGGMAWLIERGTTIPTRRSEIFTTVEHYQSVARLTIREGHHKLAAYNKKLGVLELPVPPAPRGEPIIEVRFDTDANHVLQVMAKDLNTGREVKVRMNRESAVHAAHQESDPRRGVMRHES